MLPAFGTTYILSQKGEFAFISFTEMFHDGIKTKTNNIALLLYKYLSFHQQLSVIFISSSIQLGSVQMDK
jgi:hypothetical protein